MEIVSLIGVLVGLAVFIYLAYKGYNIIFLTVLSSIIVAIFSGMNPITVLNDTWATRFSGFIKSWFLIYVLSATFAKFMGESGAAALVVYLVDHLLRRHLTAPRDVDLAGHADADDVVDPVPHVRRVVELDAGDGEQAVGLSVGRLLPVVGKGDEVVAVLRVHAEYLIRLETSVAALRVSVKIPLIPDPALIVPVHPVSSVR